MCGIFGWQFKRDRLPPMEQRTILAVALGWQNEGRGVDSYGWFNTESGVLTRGVGRIGAEARNMAAHPRLLGHTRHATKGDKTIDNAHPFSIGRIVGAHNGIIHNHDDLNKARKEKGLPENAVDSMHIFDALNEGFDIKALRGYGAIEWVDSEFPNQIRLCKMSSNADLAVVQTDMGVMWSSDKEHLTEALYVAGISRYSTMKIDSGQVYYASAGTFYIMPNVKLELGEYVYSGPYGGGANLWYKNSQGQWVQGRPEDDEEERWIDTMIGTLGPDADGEEFPFLTKKERKAFIRKRNADKSNKRLYAYSDLCRCGSWLADGEIHKRWCDKWNVIEMTKAEPLVKCQHCSTTDDKHWLWCVTLEENKPKPKPTPVVGFRPQKQGIFVNSEWVCPDCYSKPQVDDQECPNGHGRVLGQVDGQKNAV